MSRSGPRSTGRARPGRGGAEQRPAGCEACGLRAANARLYDIARDILKSGRARIGLPDDYLAIKDALGGIRAAQSKADAACSKLRDWREIEEATYDALDMIRAHPVVNDLLDRGGVDSERWYKDAGYILESLVARLIGGVGRRTSSAADSDTAVTIRAPRTAWALLLETLTLDARSSAFDPKLRKQIVQALRQVAEVDAPYILVTVKSGIPEASVFWDQGMAIKAAKREAKSLNPENDVAVVLHQGEEVFSWPQEP